MKFADFLAKQKITPAAAALALGCSRQQVWRIARRHCRPTPELTERIVAWSKNRVTHADLMKLDPDRPRRLGKAAGK